jgi:hypothetical protein
MRENFTVSFDFNNMFNFRKYMKPFVCLILAIVIIYPILGFASIHAILSIILLFLILYVILTSMTSENLSNELPSTLYPSLPHTGLDGISLNTYVAGMDTSKYIV